MEGTRLQRLMFAMALPVLCRLEICCPVAKDDKFDYHPGEHVTRLQLLQSSDRVEATLGFMSSIVARLFTLQ